MYFKISTLVIVFFSFIFFLDLLIKSNIKEEKVTNLTVEKTGSLQTSISSGEILYICGKRLRISFEAFSEIFDKPKINVEVTRILKLPKRIFVNPENKFYSYNYILLIAFITLHLLLIGLNFIFLDIKKFLSGHNTIMLFAYLWLMYF